MKFVATFFKYATDDELIKVFNSSSVGHIFDTYSEIEITKRCQDYIREKYERSTRQSEVPQITENPDKDDEEPPVKKRRGRPKKNPVTGCTIGVKFMDNDFASRLLLVLKLLNIHSADGVGLLYVTYDYPNNKVEIGFVLYRIQFETAWKVTVPMEWVNSSEDDLKDAIRNAEDLPKMEAIDDKLISKYLGDIK